MGDGDEYLSDNDNYLVFWLVPIDSIHMNSNTIPFMLDSKYLCKRFLADSQQRMLNSGRAGDNSVTFFSW